MQLTVINEHLSWYRMELTVQGKTYTLDKNTTAVTVSVEGESAEAFVHMTNKGYVHLNILDMLLGIFMGDSTVCGIYADYRFLAEQTDSDTVTVRLKDNEWNARDQLSVYTVYAESNDASVSDLAYTLAPQTKRIRRKHTRLHLFVTSLLPVGIVLLALCFLTDPPALFILLLFFWALLFGVPSVKEIRRFRALVQDEVVNEKLTEYAVRRRTHQGGYNEDTSKSGKFADKIIGKMFKFDEEQ